MLEVVRGRERGSWSILARRFLDGRVDPDRFGQPRRFRGPWKALGMAAKSLGQDSASMDKQTRSVTVLNPRRSHRGDRDVVVLLVVPMEEPAADRERVFRRELAPLGFGRDFRIRNLRQQAPERPLLLGNYSRAMRSFRFRGEVLALI